LARLAKKKDRSGTRIASGLTANARAGAATPSPSTALRTEIAGVIIPSPKNRAAPKSPMPISSHTPL